MMFACLRRKTAWSFKMLIFTSTKNRRGTSVVYNKKLNHNGQDDEDDGGPGPGSKFLLCLSLDDNLLRVFP
ncbi:unnamed protein product [Amoebophrya sp. A120]|nr:unnamed protein product [Amoebophrya sp. A120]|eukprot:GSA120T00024437001.1